MLTWKKNFSDEPKIVTGIVNNFLSTIFFPPKIYDKITSKIRLNRKNKKKLKKENYDATMTTTILVHALYYIYILYEFESKTSL